MLTQLRFVTLSSLILTSMGLVSCGKKKIKDGKPDTEEIIVDSTVYTLIAAIYGTHDAMDPGKVQASWKDKSGTAEVEPAPGVILRKEIKKPSLEQPHEFEFIYDGESFAADPLNFAECAFIKDLGYDTAEYLRLKAYFQFSKSQPDGKRQLFRGRASRPDANSVTCSRPADERISKARKVFVMNVRVQAKKDEVYEVFRDGKLLPPESFTVSGEPQYALEQTYTFIYADPDSTEDFQEDLTVKTPAGEKPIQLSLTKCLVDAKDLTKNRLIAQTTVLYLDGNSDLKEGAALCCYSDSNCAPILP